MMISSLPRFLQKQTAATALLVLPLMAGAQVSLYQFSESVGTYTEITAADGGVSLGTPTYWPQQFNNRAWVNNPFNDPGGQITQNGYLSPATGPGYPIGFNFTFNGDVFDVIGISNGGWISFGKSTDGLQAVWVYNMDGTVQGDPFVQWYNGPDPTYKRNRVAGFGNSGLQMVDWSSLNPPGQLSNIRVATIGTAPNRTCVIQWKDFGMNGDVTVAMNKINFQIRLNESDNSVEVVMGQMDWVSSLGRYNRTNCGLSGRTNQDFNGRQTAYEEPAFLYDWNNTVAMDTIFDYCQFEAPQFGQPNGSGVPPVTGLTWRWTPPVCPPPAWPFTIDQISYDYAHATWEPSGAGEYEYYLTNEPNITGPEISSGTTTDTQADFFGLEADSTYYLFVRSICDGQPGVWSTPVSFTTLRGGVVVCDGTVLTENYCSIQYNTQEWLYVSADLSPLKLEFQGGFLQGLSGESFTLWNGTQPIPGQGTTFSGDLTGQFFNAPGGAIFIRLVTDAGACEAQPWYLPLQWRVGCKNCTDPLVNFALGNMDCDNQQFYVDVNVFAMGSSSTLTLENNAGVAPTVVSSTGIHSVGPFPAGQSVVITAQNPDNLLCYVSSTPIINEPCVVQDCGPTPYTYCYANNEQRQWAYQGVGSQQIGIRFLGGDLGFGDVGNVYNGLDLLNGPAPTALPTFGSLLNKLYTSNNNDHALVLEVIADNSMSCVDADPLFGTSSPWNWVVACYDGCTQPQANFTTTCLNNTQFQVNVEVTNIGSTGSVTITNNGGVAPVTANATGTYTVGPFPHNTPVTLNVEGGSVLCTWTSPLLNMDCTGVGIAETDAGQLALWPNPNQGTFQLKLPAADVKADVQVMDATGRVVASRSITGSTNVLHVEHLPNGLYNVVATTKDAQYTARISIQH